MSQEQSLVTTLVDQASNSGWFSTGLVFLGILVGNIVTVMVGWLSFKNKKREIEGTESRNLMITQKELINELREDNQQQNETIRYLTSQLTSQNTDYENKLRELRQAMRDRVRRREQKIRELCTMLDEHGIAVPESYRLYTEEGEDACDDQTSE